MELIDWMYMQYNFRGGITLGQENGTLLGSSDKTVNEFKLEFGAYTELSFPV